MSSGFSSGFMRRIFRLTTLHFAQRQRRIGHKPQIDANAKTGIHIFCTPVFVGYVPKLA